MKPLHHFLNTDKGLLLHQLFPDEIPAALDFTLGLCEGIRENTEAHRRKWDNGFLPFETWLTLVEEAEKKIDRYGIKLSRSSRLFSDQLFDGNIAIFMTYALDLYTATRVHPEPKFTLAVKMLFGACLTK